MPALSQSADRDREEEEEEEEEEEFIQNRIRAGREEESNGSTFGGGALFY